MAGERPPDNKRRGPNEPDNNAGNGGINNQNKKPGDGQAKPNRPYQPFPEEGESYRRVRSQGRAQPPRQPVERYPAPPRPPSQMIPSSGQTPEPDRPFRPTPKGVVAAPRIKRSPKRAILFGGLGVVLIGFLVGLYFLTRVTNLFSGISVPRVDVNGQEISGSNVNGNGRVNILLLGLDSRPGTPDGTRSDTMIIVSVDQSAKTASMLSIPRDLWVDIPGHGSNRINAAYFFGDQDKPGIGGPPLAKETVARNFGIQIHYFAQVDFAGFKDVIDAIGGVNIDVKKPLIDNEYPTEDYGLKRIFVPAGIQHMDGTTALEYARSRHSDSDLGRNQRQQEVLLAVRERGANLGLITNDKLSIALQRAIKTDLQWGDVLSLAQTAIGMDKANIKTYAIDANMTQNANIDGNAVLTPDWNAIRELVKKFNNAG
jgi:LCP family protein required for cell wall assembly